MIADLAELQCELDGYAFGGGPQHSSLLVQDIRYVPGDIRTNDVAAPRADGVRYGRDYLGGQTIEIDITDLQDPGVPQLDAYAQFRKNWRASKVRAQPGEMCILRMGRAGRTRRVYGRPRTLLTTLGHESAGHTILTASFSCTDDLFYGDSEHSNTVDIIPPEAGGLIFPFTFPWSSVGISYSPGIIHVGGDEPAYMCFMIRGPIVRPVIEVVGHWAVGLNLSLRQGEWVGIDPRPWSRGVRTSSGANLGGALVPGSPRLSDLRLDPATYEVVLRGQDITGTASMTAAWRETYTSP